MPLRGQDVQSSREQLIFWNCQYMVGSKIENRILVIIYRRMSITISNCDEICKSSTNNSPAKMLYTFKREPRFAKKIRVLCDKFYNIPDKLVRTTSLGIGNKYDFTKDVPASPPPNTYNIKSDFDSKGFKGVGFGKGRQEMEVTGPFAETKKNKNPAPNCYEQDSTLKKVCFSMQGKNVKEDKEKMKIPGPGTYESVCDLSAKGKYFLAKHRTSCVRNFNHSIKRGTTLHSFGPGPGRYDTTKEQMSPEGKYVLSRMENSLVRRFGSSARQPLAPKSSTPGPGCYRLPSQFGYYLAKNAKKPSTANGKENSSSLNHDDF